jgi:hypothetical protein
MEEIHTATVSRPFAYRRQKWGSATVQTLSGLGMRKWLFSRIGSNRLGVTRFSTLGSKPSSCWGTLRPRNGVRSLAAIAPEVILKHRPGRLQRTANHGLAQQQPRCGRSDAFLFGNCGKCNQEVATRLVVVSLDTCRP